MSDIVDRLRVPIDLTTPWSNLALHADAAAEIERLRAENERLRARVEELEYGNSKAMAALAALSGVQQDSGPP